MAKPSRTRGVGDGKRSGAIARSSRGEIRHPRFGFATSQANPHSVRSALSRARSRSGGAATHWSGLARLGPRVGDAQSGRLRNTHQVGSRDFGRHHRCVGAARLGKATRPQSCGGNAHVVIRTSTSGLHGRGRHQCYLSAQGRRIGGVTRSLSSALGSRDRHIRTITRAAR